MQQRTRNSKYRQDLDRVTEMIKKSPVAVLFRVFDISIQTIASFKAKELSHRQLAIAGKELSLFLKDKSVKLPFRHCPYCTSTRLLLSFNETMMTCKCLQCSREIQYLEGGDDK